MQNYSYKAVDSAGSLHRGEMSATSAEDLDVRLSRNGLELIFSKPSLGASFLGVSFFKRKPLSRRQLIDFTFHLQQLAEAGVPLLESLQEYCSVAENKSLRAVASELIAQIESGSSLSEACALQPAVFNSLYTSMLQAGEESGRLVEILSDLLELLKWQDETLSSLRLVTIYPAFVGAVLILVIGFVMAWLVPGLLSFITSAGGELPWHTSWLIGVSNVVSDYWLFVLLAVFFSAVAGKIILHHDDAARQLWHRLLLALPLAGPVIYQIKLARFCRCSALMYSSGINLIDTLKHGENLVDNLVLSAALGQVRAKIVAGDTVSDAFQSQPDLPSLLSRMIRVGENTGGMDRAFLQTGYFYDRASRESIAKLEQSVGPILIVVVGAIMSWVVFSVIGPIYDLVFSMQGSL